MRVKKTFFAALVAAEIFFLIASIAFHPPLPLSQKYVLSSTHPERGHTYFWKLAYLYESQILLKNDPASIRRIMDEADAVLAKGPFSVMDKTSLPPSGDKHDFCDLSPYFWPNPITHSGKPYYFRDGLLNPEANDDSYDRTRYLEFLRTIQKLALGYSFSHHEKYAQRTAYLLRVWFINPETRMNPHFRHSQIIPGLTDGHSLGVIRATELVQILDALALISPSSAWTSDDHARIVQWFKDYLEWATSSTFGEKEYRMPNNHGTWYDASTSAISLFTGNPSIARDILSRSAAQRINTQISADGSQPHEMKRSRSLYYAIYNLRGMFAMAELAEQVGIDLWKYRGPQNQSIRGAVDYLVPYATGVKQWTGNRVIPDNGWVADFIPILRIAADKYQDRSYLKALKQLPRLDPSERIVIPFELEAPEY